MLFKYIGQESIPGSGSTIVFGNIRVKVGEVIDVPPQFVPIAQKNKFFEPVGAVENAVEKSKDFAYGKDRDTSKGVQPKTIQTVEDLDKARLIAEAEAKGVKIDKRGNLESIQKTLDAAAVKTAATQV